MIKKIYLSEPHLDRNDTNSVKKAIEDGWVSTAGKSIKNFENLITNYTKSKYCVACNSGTSGLHIALKVVGVSNDDEVIVPSISFIATINAVKYNNANPIFIDVDKNFNLDEEKVLSFLKENTYKKKGYSVNKKTKKIIKAIVIAHIWGGGAKIKKIIQESKKRNIKIVEDAAESLGTFYTKKYFKKKHTGTVGDIGVLSFNGNKIITTGAGGAILTNNINYEKKSRYLINQAKNNELFVHNELGYNYRIPSLNANLGISQLKKISKIKKNKKKIHLSYKKKFLTSKIFDLYNFPKISENNYWMNLLILKKGINKKFIEFLIKYTKKKIEFRKVWLPNERQKNYIQNEKYKITESKILYDNSICIPSSSNIKKENISFIFKMTNDAYKKYNKSKN
jgi:perosamine synthetase